MRTTGIGCLLLAWLFALPAASLAATSATRLVPADHADYIYAGRVDFSRPAAPVFYWAGNSATIGFTGPTLGVVLDAPSDDVYFDVIIDGDGKHRHVIRSRKGRHYYTVAIGLADTRHTVQILRRVDPTYPGVAFVGIRIARGAQVFRPTQKHRLKIVFYGDSITSGLGVLDATPKNIMNAVYMDSYMSYAAVAARTLDAAYRSISLSGIGILKSWFPLTMPQMYSRVVPHDPDSHWNFSQWTPDIVVVNLLQNDAWLLPRETRPPSGATIVDAYMHFIEALRTHYPQSTIICMLGDMDAAAASAPWSGYVRTAVQRMRASGDRRIHALIVPYKGTPRHPDVAEQHAMANALVKTIRSLGGSGSKPSLARGKPASAARH